MSPVQDGAARSLSSLSRNTTKHPKPPALRGCNANNGRKRRLRDGNLSESDDEEASPKTKKRRKGNRHLPSDGGTPSPSTPSHREDTTPGSSKHCPIEVPDACACDTPCRLPPRRLCKTLSMDTSNIKTKCELRRAGFRSLVDWADLVQRDLHDTKTRLAREQKRVEEMDEERAELDQDWEKVAEAERKLKERKKQQAKAQQRLEEEQKQLEEDQALLEDEEADLNFQLSAFERRQEEFEEKEKAFEEERRAFEEERRELERRKKTPERAGPRPPLRTISDQAERMRESCRKGIEAQLKWKAGKSKRDMRFAYEGEAPTPSAFYLLLGLSESNRRNHYVKAGSILREDFERYLGRISKDVSGRTLLLRGREINYSWDCASRKFVLWGRYGF